MGGRTWVTDAVGNELDQPMESASTTILAAALIRAPRAGKAAACAAVHIYLSQTEPDALPPARARQGPCMVRRAGVVDRAGLRCAAAGGIGQCARGGGGVKLWASVVQWDARRTVGGWRKIVVRIYHQAEMARNLA